MRKYKVLRLGGKGYTIFSPTPLTTKRVITTLRGVSIDELKEIPDGAELCARAISFAIAGSGMFSQLRSCILRRRLLRRASLDELIDALPAITSMIPANEFYTISLITNQFNKLISK